MCVSAEAWLCVCYLVLYRQRQRLIYLLWGRWGPFSTARRTGKVGRWVKRLLFDQNPKHLTHWAELADPTELHTENAKANKLSTLGFKCQITHWCLPHLTLRTKFQHIKGNVQKVARISRFSALLCRIL